MKIKLDKLNTGHKASTSKKYLAHLFIILTNKYFK